MADVPDYVLSRNHSAAGRLNLQHFLWREALKFNIHPSVKLPSSPVIADIATGTAMWTLQVAREYPEAHLDALDIDLAQAPSKHWLPSNVKLRQWNLFDGVPPDMVGKYDFVHMRCIVCFVSDENMQRVVQNLLKLLKPSGYLQWDEIDCVNMHVKKPDPSIPTPAIDKVREAIFYGGANSWTVDLPRIVSDGGFSKADINYYGDDDHIVRAFHDQHMMTMEEIAVGWMQRAGKQGDAADLFRLINAASSESAQGAALCLPRVVCVAQK